MIVAYACVSRCVVVACIRVCVCVCVAPQQLLLVAVRFLEAVVFSCADLILRSCSACVCVCVCDSSAAVVCVYFWEAVVCCV